MIKLVEISKEELRPLVEFSYDRDYDLLEKYHFEKDTSYDEAVRTTLEAVEGVNEILNLRFFAVKILDFSIGYVITSGDFLYSFGVGIDYRVKSVLKSWWEEILKVTGQSIKVGLLKNNDRSIEYMKARGLKVIWDNPKGQEILLSL